MEDLKVVFAEEKEGVFAYAFVANPAIEEDFIYLNSQRNLQIIQLKTIDEEKGIVITPVLIPNKKIYRYDERTKTEFNIVFPAETIEMAQKHFLARGFQTNANIEHDGNLIEGVSIMETWIKEDETHDKSIKYGFDLPVGTWFWKLSVDNLDLREKIKKGEVKGISIEGNFDLEKINLAKNMSFKEQIRNALAEILGEKAKQEETPTIELGAIATADASLKIEFEGEALAQDAEVWMTDENGEKQSVPDGEYALENDMIAVIADSKCVEIKEHEAPNPEEDVAMADEKYTALEAKVNELANAFENFKVSMATQIAEGFTKLSEAVKEEEKEVEEIKLTKKQEQKELKEIKEGSLKDRLKSILNN